MKPIVHIVNHFLRVLDVESAQNVDMFIANSNETKERIQKFYRKDATVIYPPVDIPGGKNKVTSDTKERSFYLAGGRLARAKRVDIAVMACTELGIPLKVFGKSFAGYGDELREMAGPTVEFLGEVTDTEKGELMRKAKAYIFPSEFEDFGITPVESMAFGTPVIAFRSGGVQETIIEGKTGVFFDHPNTESLKKAIKKFEKMKFKSADCIKQSEKFTKKHFKEEILKIVEGIKK
jgi:glycosyltransferase involved in cell wall biosynthesis